MNTTKKKMSCTNHSRKTPITKVTRKLAVQTTTPPNTKRKVKEGKYMYCKYGGTVFML